MTKTQAVADPARAEARALWSDALEAFKARDYAAAADLLGRLTEGGLAASGLPEAAVRLQYGVTLLRLRRTEAGVEQLKRAVALDPTSARAHHKLGAGLARLRLDLEALPWLERSVELNPASAEYHWRLGEQYRRVGRSREARTAFERALELEPGYPGAVEGLGQLDRAAGSWMDALKRRFGRG